MYEQSARPKSDLYIDLLAAINSRRVSLLDHPKLISQLTALERRVARSGRDSVDHPPGGHDDVANAVAGLCSAAISRYANYDTTYRAWDDHPTQPNASSADDRLRQFYQTIDGAFRCG